jgi:hypothetical protein
MGFTVDGEHRLTLCLYTVLSVNETKYFLLRAAACAASRSVRIGPGGTPGGRSGSGGLGGSGTGSPGLGGTSGGRGEGVHGLPIGCLQMW